MRLQVLVQVQGGGGFSQDQGRRRSLLEVETHAVLLRQAVDEDRVWSLGLQAVQAGTSELRMLPRVNSKDPQNVTRSYYPMRDACSRSVLPMPGPPGMRLRQGLREVNRRNVP